MSVSLLLGQAGFTASALDTVATVTLEGLDVTGVHLTIQGKIPNITSEKFFEVTKIAEANCIISKALKVPITSEAVLLK
jgi:osmotically inducible protein OsmC